MNNLKNKPSGFLHRCCVTAMLAFMLFFGMVGGANATVSYLVSTAWASGNTIWLRLDGIAGSTGYFTIGKISGAAFSSSGTFRITKDNNFFTDVAYTAGSTSATFNANLGLTPGTANWKAQRYSPYDAIQYDPNVVSGYIPVQTVVESPPPPSAPTLSYPYNGAQNIPTDTDTVFSWSSVANNANYRLVISQYADFRGFTDLQGNSYCDGTCLTVPDPGAAALIQTSYPKNGMNLDNHVYYWKVRANTPDGGSSAWSNVYTFTTKAKISPIFVNSFTPQSNPVYTNTDTVFMITGGNFTPQTVAEIVSASCSSQYISSSSLQATCRYALPGTLATKISDPVGGVVSSSTVTFENKPLPPASVSSVNPSSAFVGDATPFVVSGSNFTSQTKLDIQGLGCSSNFVDAGTFNMTCQTKTEGNLPIMLNGTAIGTTVTFKAKPPIDPVVSGIKPASAFVGDSTTFVVSGSNFTSETKLDIQGLGCSGNFIDASTFNMTCQTKLEGTLPVTLNGTGTSATVSFTVKHPFDPVVSVNPASAFVGDSTTFVIRGANFTSQTKLDIQGLGCSSNFVDAGTFNMTCQTKTEGTLPVTLNGTVTGAIVTFKAKSPIDSVVSSIEPASAIVGEATPFVVSGSNFTSQTKLDIQGLGCSSNFVDASTFNMTCQTKTEGNLPVTLNGTATNATVTFNQKPTTGGGLVAYYCFDDATNLGKDCSTNGNNGTSVGTVTSITGWKGNAASFGGYSSPASIRIPNSASLQFSQDFSVVFAVNMTGFNGMNGYGSNAALGVHALIAKSHDRTGMALLAYSDATGNVNSGVASYEWGTNGNGIGGVAPNSGIGKWVHLTYIFSNTQHTAKIYANGVLINTKTGFNQSFASINSQNLYLGKFSDTWYPLNGSLDEVRIYNRALTDAEVAALYQPSEPPVTASAIFDVSAQSEIVMDDFASNYDAKNAKVVELKNMSATPIKVKNVVVSDASSFWVNLFVDEKAGCRAANYTTLVKNFIIPANSSCKIAVGFSPFNDKVQNVAGQTITLVTDIGNKNISVSGTGRAQISNAYNTKNTVIGQATWAIAELKGGNPPLKTFSSAKFWYGSLLDKTAQKLTPSIGNVIVFTGNNINKNGHLGVVIQSSPVVVMLSMNDVADQYGIKVRRWSVKPIDWYPVANASKTTWYLPKIGINNHYGFFDWNSSSY